MLRGGEKEVWRNAIKRGRKEKCFQSGKQIVKENRDVVGIDCVKEKEGYIMADDAKILEVWKMHHDKLLN